MAQIFDRGDPVPRRPLTFTIDVTDEGTTTGPPVNEHRTFSSWQPIGVLTFTNAVVSYNGDRVRMRHHRTGADKETA